MQDSLMGIDKRSAIVGFVGGFLVLCTIGFFILLGILLGDGKSDSVAFVSPTANTGDAIAPSGNQPPPAAAEVALPPVKDNEHIRGNKKASVTLVEYSDTECPFCKKYHETVNQVLAQDKYKDTVRLVYRHYPLRGLHQKAAREAEATECAAELGGNDAFWKYLDQIFARTQSNDSLDTAQLPQIAQDIKLNRKKFEECLNSGKKAAVVAEHEASGNAAGVQGTPHSIVITADGKKIPFSGALDAPQLQQILDSAL